LADFGPAKSRCLKDDALFYTGNGFVTGCKAVLRYASAFAPCILMGIPLVILSFTFSTSLHAADNSACLTCHEDKEERGQAELISNLQKSVHHKTACAQCHRDIVLPHSKKPAKVDCSVCHKEAAGRFAQSAHGRQPAEGGGKDLPQCVNCHGSHLILQTGDRESKTNKRNLPAVCGACHQQVYNEYKVSIHGTALQEGKLESPGCTDCHGAHDLAMVKDPGAGVNPKNISSTCARCHTNEEIIRKYHLPSDRYSSYAGSFHGVSIKYGDVTAANCTSCHEVHRILPASNAESSIHPQNLGKTCGKCHPALKDAASIGRIHVEARKGSSRGMYYVRKFYIWFIGILMVLFVAYILLDVYGRVRRGRDGKRN
jgi:hypothetical protein